MDSYPLDSVTPVVRSPDDADTSSSFVVPTRMGFRWRYFNHRISRWSFHPVDGDRLDVRARGGPYSAGLGRQEYPRLDYRYQRVVGDDQAGPVAARRSLEIVVGPSGIYSGTASWELDELGLAEFDHVVALVHGFGFNTGIPQTSLYPSDYDAAAGYISRGVGVGVDVARHTDEAVDLDYWVRFGFGASLDRPAHNEATLEARIGTRLDVVLVGFDGPDPRTGAAEYDREYDEPLIGVDQSVEPPPLDRRRVEFAKRPGDRRGFVGLQSFNFNLTPKRSCEWTRDWPMGDRLRADGGGDPRYGPPGYYLREMTVSAERLSGEHDSGAVFDLEGYASNATYSIPFHRFRSQFAGRMIWIPCQAEVREHDIAADFPTGGASFSLE